MLTDLQERILRFIRQYLAAEGRAPTLAEIGRAVGVRSRGTVHRYVQALTEKGYLQRTPPRGWRRLRLAEEGERHGATLPLVGRIAAGRPIEAIPGRDEIDLSEFFTGPNRFVLKVRGDSMREAGILDGDMVIVERRETADDGAIVVALIDGEEATLKRLRHRRDGALMLVPENAALSPLIYSAERVRIQGVVVGQMRAYP